MCAGHRRYLPKKEGLGSISLTGELTVGLGQMVRDATKGREVWKGKIPHDFGRTAVRNMVCARSNAVCLSGGRHTEKQ